MYGREQGRDGEEGEGDNKCEGEELCEGGKQVYGQGRGWMVEIEYTDGEDNSALGGKIGYFDK